jgi:hypothetical protein
MLDRLRTAWLIFQNWRRFRARMQAHYAKVNAEARVFTIRPLYPFGVGEECPMCHCIYDDAGSALDWQRPGCHCVCHD